MTKNIFKLNINTFIKLNKIKLTKRLMRSTETTLKKLFGDFSSKTKLILVFFPKTKYLCSFYIHKFANY